ncbi:MAG: hypothetical protein HKN03_07830 [Acidimicrobiales bacterium]|nr:hypothetical protein [Acidimicrobiales bacterium]
MVTVDAIRVSVIGEVGVRVPDSGFQRLQPAQRQLLALLVASGPSGLTADILADEIWPDRLPNQWQASLRMTVSRLRRSSGVDFVKLVDGRYRLELGAHQVDAWYAQQIAARPGAALTSGDANRFSEILGSTEIYPGVEPTLTIEASIREIATAQADLVHAAARQGLELRRPVLRSLYRRVLAAPYEEDLGCSIARLHANVGLLSPAKELLDLVRTEIVATFGTELGQAGRQLQRQLDSGAFGPAAFAELGDEIEALGPSVPTALRIDESQPTLRDGAAKEVAAELISADPGIVLLGGPAGSDRRGFTAAVLHRAGSPLGRVLLGTCTEGVSLTYEPFLKFLPGLRRRISRAGLEGSGINQTVLWSSAAEELSAIAAGRPVTVVIADCHNLDSASLDLLLFLARSSLGFPLRFLLEGQSDVEQSEFKRLAARLKVLVGISPHTLAPLTLDEVGRLVSFTYPHASSVTVRGLSEEILLQSKGLPTVVRAVIQSLDPRSLRLPHVGTGQTFEVFSRQVAKLSPAAQSVGVAAAVLGLECSLSDLEQMCDVEFDDLLDIIDELLDTGLMIETTGVDQIAFAHRLAMDEFLTTIRGLRLRQLHLRARNLSDDPHRRARHDLLAFPTVPAAEARASQLRSARLLHAAGSFREAADAYRNALGLDESIPLEMRDATRFADAVSRTGALTEAAELRSEIIGACFAEGDWSSALDAAIAGLPEAELIDGDPERFAQLSAIPFTKVERPRQFELAIHLTRQASLLGREQVARTWVDRAAEAATSASERAAAVVAWRMANDVSVAPADRLDRVERALLNTADDRSRLPLLQLRALDRYQVGDTAIALDANAEFAALSARLSLPLRQWHAQLFESMHHYTTGGWGEARKIADDALAHGQRYGISIAVPTRLAQEFFLMWLTNTHGDLTPVFETTPPDDASSLLFKAAHAVSLHASGEESRAIRKALLVTKKVLGAPAAHGLAAVALVAPVLAISNDDELVDQVRQLFVPLRGNALIVGAGVANLGPIDRYEAQLSGPLDEISARRVVGLADALGMPLWRLKSRLDLAQASDSLPDMASIVPIAAGTGLEALLPTDGKTARSPGS